MGYSAITNAEIDAESPSKDTLMTKYRDNLLQVEEWIKNRIDDMIVSNWKAQTPGGAQPINSVWYNEDTGRWVFVGDASITRFSDNDGIDWTAAAVNPWAGGDDVIDVSYDGSALWASCGDDTGNRGVATSPDGTNWTIRDAKLGGDTGRGIAHDLSGTWVVVGDNGKISSSADGVNWTARASGVATDLYGVCFGEGLFIAVGAVSGGVGVILTSPDGIVWTSRASGVGANNLRDVHWNGTDLLVAVGVNGKYTTSSDGITWAAADTGTENYESVHFDSGRWIAVTLGGELFSSPDGSTWTQRSTVHATSAINTIAHNGGPCWIAAGAGPTLSTSLLDPNRNVIP